MRTKIEIEDELMQKAMLVSGLRSKEEVVNSALLEFIQRRTQKDLAKLQGTIRFAHGYDHKAARDRHLRTSDYSKRNTRPPRKPTESQSLVLFLRGTQGRW